MSWSPPHPAPPGPPPPPYGYGYPAVPPPVAPPAPRPKRRSGLVVLLVALPLALLIAVGGVVGNVLGGTKQISDGQQRVSLTVPLTWTNDAGPDAGQRVEQGEDSYTIPDIETGGLWLDVAVFIEPRTGRPLSQTLAETADEECEFAGCVGRDSPVATEVNGRRGWQQILRHPEGDSTVVLAIESETLVVTLLGFAIDEDQEKVAALLRTVVVNR